MFLHFSGQKHLDVVDCAPPEIVIQCSGLLCSFNGFYINYSISQQSCKTPFVDAETLVVCHMSYDVNVCCIGNSCSFVYMIIIVTSITIQFYTYPENLEIGQQPREPSTDLLLHFNLLYFFYIEKCCLIFEILQQCSHTFRRERWKAIWPNLLPQEEL